MLLTQTSNGIHLECKWCGYLYDGIDTTKILLVGRDFIHVDCNHNCKICEKEVKSLEDKDRRVKSLYHKSCSNKIFPSSKICPVHTGTYISDFNSFWPVADLKNNWKSFPSEYRAYMREQYKIIRLATNIPKEIVWMIVERAVYPYGYATEIQNEFIIKNYCTILCASKVGERCRCGEFLQYLDNYSPKCRNGVCTIVPCNKCGCRDCGFKCLRGYSNYFIEINITPIYTELLAHFSDKLIGTNLTTSQISRQLCYLSKLYFTSIPHDTKIKLISSLFHL